MKNFKTTKELHRFWDNNSYSISKRKFDNKFEVVHWMYTPCKDKELIEELGYITDVFNPIKRWITVGVFNELKKAKEFLSEVTIRKAKPFNWRITTDTTVSNSS
jgi:hypothetical protein